MFATMIKFFKNEDGATAIEYGLIAALIAVAGSASEDEAEALDRNGSLRRRVCGRG